MLTPKQSIWFVDPSSRLKIKNLAQNLWSSTLGFSSRVWDGQGNPERSGPNWIPGLVPHWGQLALSLEIKDKGTGTRQPLMTTGLAIVIEEMPWLFSFYSSALARWSEIHRRGGLLTLAWAFSFLAPWNWTCVKSWHQDTSLLALEGSYYHTANVSHVGKVLPDCSLASES